MYIELSRNYEPAESTSENNLIAFFLSLVHVPIDI